jgi:hypothetical protein
MFKTALPLILALTALMAVGCSDDAADETTGGVEEEVINYPESPAGRLVSLDAPEGPSAARAAGCTVLGAYAGSGLGSLAILSGGLDQNFKADGAGEVGMVLVGEVENFTLDAPMTMNILMGGQDEENGFTKVAPADSIVDPEAVNATFNNIVLDDDGWFDAVTQQLRLPVPILEDFMVAAGINAATMSGQMNVTEDGLTFDGLLMGYLPAEEVMKIAMALIDACSWDETPIICDITAGQITATTEPQDAYEIIVGFMGHYDVRIENGIPVECDIEAAESDPTGCNALGVCLEVEMEAITLP